MVTDKKYKFTVWLKKNKSAIKTIIATFGTLATEALVTWNPTTPVMMTLKLLTGLIITIGFRALLDFIDLKLPDFVEGEDKDITTL